MKKKLFVLLTSILLLTLVTACGSKHAASGTQNGEPQAKETTLTGTLDEKKDFTFVVTDDDGNFYQFSIDASAKPDGYTDLAVGDSVTVTYTGTVSEVDPFDGKVLSVEKVE